jgi:hypothetical protein
MKRVLVFLLGLICFISCRKEEIDGLKYTLYQIKKGQHSSKHGISTHSGMLLKFKARFDGSAVYETSSPMNQLDINKLYGVSDCNSHHQKNSARFGWRWHNGNLEIHAYVYNNGERRSQFITTVDLNKVYDYEIMLLEDAYVFKVNNEYKQLPRIKKCKRGVFYKLYPYFGGDETAPHDITIAIHEKKTR